MALIRPILYSISAFDATNSQIFTFNVSGGDQVVKNRLVISKQSDNTIVYDNIQTTFAFRHVLPENTLINGEYYSAYITTYNSANEQSLPSLGIQFYCFSTPSFVFSNIPINRIINNASYNFIVTYDQNELEYLKSYTFNLYNSERVLLTSSGVQYISSASTLPLNINYTFSGLNDEETYYIEVNGQTMHGMVIDTGFVLFSVQYETPNVFSIISLNNNCEGGYITIKSNLVGIDGEANPYPPVYVDDNTAIDLTGVGDYVLWNSGYEINGDFTASLWGRNFNDNNEIIILSDGIQTLKINYRKDENGRYYAELIVKEGFYTYYLYTNSIYVYSGDTLQIWFRRINSLYEIGLYDLSERPDLILDSSTRGLIGINILG